MSNIGNTQSALPLCNCRKKNEWKSAIVISSEREGVVTAQPYTDETTYTTEEAADTHGITLGQQIIDGKVPELSEN